jgi:hypothetical protein
MKKEHETLCWRCQKAGGKCSWSKSFIPIEGWKAIPTKLKINDRSRRDGETDSFDIYECPEFELMERLK